jgi:hypothetical protein
LNQTVDQESSKEINIINKTLVALYKASIPLFIYGDHIVMYFILMQTFLQRSKAGEVLDVTIMPS